MARFLPFYAVALTLTIAAADAAPLQWHPLHVAKPSPTYLYVDKASQLKVTVPSGWHVRAETLNGIRQLRVVPPKADQRERAAIDVVIRVRPFARKEKLPRMAAAFRRAQGDREAADSILYTPRTNRLIADYREGSYVSSRLWIVRRNLVVYQRVDKRRLMEARCGANASEYKTYRRNLETICTSVTYGNGDAD